MRRVLVDGYNLLLRTGRNADEDARDQLIRDAARYRGAHRADVVVVFDARGSTGTAAARHPPGVRVTYPRDADAAIVAEVRRSQNPRDIVVMTADRELGDRVRALGARVETGDDLQQPKPKRSRGLPPTATTDKPTSVSKKDVEYWLRAFDDREEDDDF